MLYSRYETVKGKRVRKSDKKINARPEEKADKKENGPKPMSKMNKEELLAIALEKSIELNGDETKKDLIELLAPKANEE